MCLAVNCTRSYRIIVTFSLIDSVLFSKLIQLPESKPGLFSFQEEVLQDDLTEEVFVSPAEQTRVLPHEWRRNPIPLLADERTLDGGLLVELCKDENVEFWEVEQFSVFAFSIFKGDYSFSERY